MALFNKKLKPDDYELIKEGSDNVMRINTVGVSYLPSLEDDAVCMARTVEKLVENPNVTRIVFVDRRNYSYPFDQIEILREIASLYSLLVKRKKLLGLDSVNFGQGSEKYSEGWRANLQGVLLNLLKGDPIGAFVEIKRLIREEKARINLAANLEEVNHRNSFLELLMYIHGILESTKLVQLIQGKIAGHEVGSRSLYKEIFRPVIGPDFMFTRLMAEPPLDAKELDTYSIGKNAEVSLYRIKGNIKFLYHLNPPEFGLDEDKYELMDLARRTLAEHKPKHEEFLDTEKMRSTFFNIGKDLLQELAQRKNISLKLSELSELASILVRYTVGFGLIEVLLNDPKVQDIAINGPIGESPIFLVHQDYDECVTNIFPSKEDGEGWASKFRVMSGRPLDEANPVLDTELNLPKARARVAIVSRPLNPVGLAYSIRRHRDDPWTLPLFIKNGMLNPMAAGLLSFLIDGNRSMLIAGTRGSGKTSILGAALVEIMRKYRILSVEDTLEIPIDALRKLGYNIQPLKVRSALTKGGSEIEADEGIRTTLRLGDSALIVGEIRSTEALALFEAMRIGALSNVVAGTIHGASPYGVYDRLVNDLKVPKTSFKAADIILVANPIRSADGLHKVRRCLQISEVRKNWENDPVAEGGFNDLMKYDAKEDTLKPSDNLINGDSDVLKDIAGGVREWVGNWDAVWENIMLRAKVKESIVDYSNKFGNRILEAPFVIKSNDVFHQVSDEVREEVGSIDTKRVFYMWNEWMRDEIKKITSEQ